MKALLIEQHGSPFYVDEVRISEPKGREVLIDVRAAGLCQSDISAAKSDLGFPMPALLGHESAGVVTAVGPDVTEFAPGDHVVACLISHCGECSACRSNRSYECTQPGVVQRAHDDEPRLVSSEGVPVFQAMDLGGFAEQMLVHENNLVKVPDEIPFDRACVLGCGVVTGAGAVINAARISFGDTVAVIGCGGVGLNAIQAAALTGARRIIAIDISDEKLETARRFGATHVVNSMTENAVDAVRALTDGGVDFAFEFAGILATTEAAIEMTRPGGETVLVGMHKPGTTLEIGLGFPYLEKHARIRAVKMGLSNFKVDIPRYAELYLQGRFNLDDLVHRHVRLEDVNEAYDDLLSGAGGVARTVVVFD